MDQTKPESNGILSEQAAAEENRARGIEATVAVGERDDEKSEGAVDIPWYNVQERRAQALRSAQALTDPADGVTSLLQNAEAIDAWLKTGESS